MSFALQSFDQDFFDEAPQRYCFAMDLPQPAEDIWTAALGGPDPLTWVRGLRVVWTSAAPLGAGSTRTAYGAFGAIRLYERFFVWDEGRRVAFRAERSNVPLFRRFGEDYVVEPTPAGCRFTWTFCAEARGPRAAAALNHAVQRGMFAAMARDTTRHFGGTVAAREIRDRIS